MKIQVVTTDNFEREVKKLLKKYRSLKKELDDFQQTIIQNPKQGTKIKENTYKIRLAVKSKGTGKSGGMRIITFVHEVVEQENGEILIYLVSIYDKSDKGNISSKFLDSLLDEIFFNHSLNDDSPTKGEALTDNVPKLDKDT